MLIDSNCERVKLRHLATTLKRFDIAYSRLASAIDDIDSDTSELIAKDYPFMHSFDELNIGSWVETCLVLIERKRQQLREELAAAKKQDDHYE